MIERFLSGTLIPLAYISFLTLQIAHYMFRSNIIFTIVSTSCGLQDYQWKLRWIGLKF